LFLFSASVSTSDDSVSASEKLTASAENGYSINEASGRLTDETDAKTESDTQNSMENHTDVVPVTSIAADQTSLQGSESSNLSLDMPFGATEDVEVTNVLETSLVESKSPDLASAEVTSPVLNCDSTAGVADVSSSDGVDVNYQADSCAALNSVDTSAGDGVQMETD
jgi:hypothetical protein